jgi:hypothetical protein
MPALRTARFLLILSYSVPGFGDYFYDIAW